MTPSNSAYNRVFGLISIITVVLLAIAYLTHLTALEIDPRLDEIRRALVTLEMMLRDNFMVPTLNGEPYLNKPPLYNWLLALSYKTFGVNEFALRMPVIVAIFWFGWLIYRFTSKFISRQAAIIAALLFITNGRILIYDSLIGLIDILYSSFVYLGFMVLYTYGKKEKWYQAFIYSYLLVVVGYLMKGLPSLVYQAFLLFVFFVLIEKKWKILFHKAHFAGAGIMAALLGTYYYFYFREVNLPPAELFKKIFTESTMRTFKGEGNWFKDFIIHFTTYPLVFAYHYAPWTLMLLFLVRKKGMETLRKNPFVWFNALLFFACFFIYWLSPYIIARYMFMLLPLCFTVAAYYATEVVSPDEKVISVIYKTLSGLLLVLGFACIALPFISYTNHVPGVFWKSLTVAAMLAGCGYFAFRYPSLRLSFIILGIVCSRFGFNWFVVDQRGGYIREQKMHAEKVIKLAENKPIYVEKSDPRANYAEQVNRDGLTYIYELKKNKILPMADTIKPGALYITDSFSMVKKPHIILYRWTSTGQSPHFLVEYPFGNGLNR